MGGEVGREEAGTTRNAPPHPTRSLLPLSSPDKGPSGPLSPMYLPGRRPTAHDVSPRSCPCRQRDRGGHAVGPVAPRAVLHWPRGSAVHASPLECAERRSQPPPPHLPCCRTMAQLTLGRARRRCISLPGEVDPDKSDYLRGIMVITGEWTGLDWCVRICPALKAPTRSWQLVPKHAGRKHLNHSNAWHTWVAVIFRGAVI